MSWWGEFKLWMMTLIQIVLWIVMIIAGLQILIFWIFTFITKGLIDPTTVQYSILVAVGSYFCLIIDKAKIYDALNDALSIKRELPFFKSQTKKVG